MSHTHTLWVKSRGKFLTISLMRHRLLFHTFMLSSNIHGIPVPLAWSCTIPFIQSMQLSPKNHAIPNNYFETHSKYMSISYPLVIDNEIEISMIPLDVTYQGFYSIHKLGDIDLFCMLNIDISLCVLAFIHSMNI